MHNHYDLAGPSYRTADHEVSFFSGMMPSISFYLSMMMIVYRASRKAKRSLLDRLEWSRSCYSILRSLEKVGVHVQISGLDNVQEVDGPCIFVCNHMSTLETFVLPAMLLPHKDITFIIKRSLVRYPVFRHVMLATQPIVIDRKNPRNDLVTVLRDGTAMINSGKSIVVFPQTTRMTRFNPDEFNTLGIKLAKRSGAPVIPVALKTDAWGCGTIVKDFGRIDPSRIVHFEFGRQIEIRGRGDREHKCVTGFIGEHLNEWQQSGER
jgi:1-acyl-sn-glycerol-3-phosphate acyltransferase